MPDMLADRLAALFADATDDLHIRTPVKLNVSLAADDLMVAPVPGERAESSPRTHAELRDRLNASVDRALSAWVPRARPDRDDPPPDSSAGEPPPRLSAAPGARAHAAVLRVLLSWQRQGELNECLQ